MSSEDIKEDYDNGMRLADIADKHGKSEATIWQIAKQAGWKRVKPPRSHSSVEVTYEELANRLGIQRRTLHDYASLYEESELCDRIQSLDPEGKRWKPVKNDNNYTYGWRQDEN